MASRLSGVNPLHEPMLVYSQFGPNTTIFIHENELAAIFSASLC